ncbi:hypothetical protein DFH09DRAFT_1105978 [Mycena vulgaris]|nr:hypothetical protein DFH09DRAFT_1105978 [Mycena vulgaris]
MQAHSQHRTWYPIRSRQVHTTRGMIFSLLRNFAECEKRSFEGGGRGRVGGAGEEGEKDTGDGADDVALVYCQFVSVHPPPASFADVHAHARVVGEMQVRGRRGEERITVLRSAIVPQPIVERGKIVDGMRRDARWKPPFSWEIDAKKGWALRSRSQEKLPSSRVLTEVWGAAALHLAQRDIPNLILAVHTLSSDEATKEALLVDAVVKTRPIRPTILVYELDLDRPSSVVSFASKIRVEILTLNILFLNAGMVSLKWDDAWNEYRADVPDQSTLERLRKATRSKRV